MDKLTYLTFKNILFIFYQNTLTTISIVHNCWIRMHKMEISNSITQTKKDESLLQKLHTHNFTSWLKQQVTILFIL